MHGGREGRFSSAPSQFMLTDDTNTNTSTSIESACLPIGCSVSAKYRGAFCSAQVKTVERQIKLKVTLLHTGDIMTISEEQIVQPAVLRIGYTVTIRVPSLNRHDTNSYLSRSGLAAIINANGNHEEKQAIIKQVYDNSIYTVVFNDGDEKSLRRSSLCLQGIRLYQTQIGQQKLLEDIPTSTLSTNNDAITSIVAVRRSGNNNQHAFPALILKRKSLADYMWIKSFLDGREYIVHKRDDVESYKTNSDIQSLCRLTSKQATKACEKFIKYNQIPIIWQKKKKKSFNNEQDDESHTNDNDSDTSETDVDDSDEETTEEKDSFVAQLFAFMDDRGTPINNIPKVHNYDLDLHRLFKIVRVLGGFNKVTKNDQWSKVYIKMGLPDEASPKNNRLIENAYKKYLFAYEDLAKKLGTMNAPSAYFGGRTSLSCDSRRSLIRVRQQSDDKSKSKQISTSNKQQPRKGQSTESKQTVSSTKNSSIGLRRKTIVINKTKSSNILSSSTSESETSDDETITSSLSNNKKTKKQQLTSSKKINSSCKKSSETKNTSSPSVINSQQTDERTHLALVKKPKSTTDTENDMKPVIKIPKISYELLKESTLTTHKFHKREASNKNPEVQPDTSINQSNKETSDQEQSNSHGLFSESIKQIILHDLTPLQVTPVSPSPPPSITDESSALPSIFTNIERVNNPYDDTPVLEAPSIFQTILPSSLINQQTNEIETVPSNSNKRSYSDDNYKTDEQLSPSKRSRHSLDSTETISKKQSRHTRLTYEDIFVNDILLVKRNLDRKKQSYAICIEKNNHKKELRVHYKGLDSKHDEWIEFHRVIKRQNEIDSNEEEIIEGKNRTIERNKTISNDQDNGIWKSLAIASVDEGDVVSCSSTIQNNKFNHRKLHSIEETTGPRRTTSTNNNGNIISINTDNVFDFVDDNESIHDDDYIQQTISQRRLPILKIDLTGNINIEDIPSTSDILLNPLYINEEIIDDSLNNQQPIASSLPPNSSPDNRRASTRQPKRRTFRDSKDSSISMKKRTRLDAEINSNFHVDNIINNSDHIPIPIEQQSVEIKRCRTVGKRVGKRTVNQQDNENEDFHLNSLVNITLRQQLEDMFKNRSSRYNFLDLNNDITGDDRLAHLKDRMRQCQKVFINLKSALTKVEKQRKLFLRRQKSLVTQSTTNGLLLPSTCT